MAETLVIEPDSAFIKQVIAAGGGDLKKCFQCATCSSVCALNNNGFSFPRRLVLQAQWGLKEKVLADPALWLCHDCGDCTANCPRGAKPSQVMDALRGEAIRHFAFPRFAGALVSNPKFLPLLIVIPFVVLRVLTMIVPGEGFSRPFIFAQLFPEKVLEPLFFVVAGFVTLGLAVSLARFVKSLRTAGVEGSILHGLGPALVEIMAHKRFEQCVANRRRAWGHRLTLFGFAGLATTGTAVGIATLLGLLHTPLPTLSGWKLFANFSAVLILAGVTMLLIEREKTPENRAATTYFDGFFLLVLAGTAATGLLSEFLRLAQTPEIMYFVYFIHLTLVFMLFLYTPYSKFVHFLYRTVVIAATRSRGSVSPAARPAGA